MNNSFMLADIFSDNMILQRESNIPIWGKGIDGTKIKVEFCGQSKDVEVQNGKWSVVLSPVNVGGPFELKVSSENEELVLHNILTGDVWIAGGQSNMEFVLKDSLTASEDIPGANYSNLRHYHVPKIEYEDEKTVIPKSSWSVCTPETAKFYSAVAYHFAKNVQSAVNVPIGIINCNWGGTSASCWMSREYLMKDSEIKSYLDEYNEIVKDVTEEVYDRKRKEFDDKIAEIGRKVEEFKREHPEVPEHKIGEHVEPFPWPPPMGPKCFLRPAGLYYTMVKKVAPFAARGVIWYQGESDTHKPKLYSKLFGMMIQNWREDWNNPELPFLFVQLPSFGTENPQGEEWAYLRESQLVTSKRVKNAAMTVAIDCGEKDDIHPKNKKPVGERLALLAEAVIYSQGVEYSGPVYKSMEVTGSKIVLHFDHVDGGLEVRGETLKGFKLCGEDKRFVSAKAEIVGDTVEVYSDEVSNPVAVRFGWSNYTEVNLYNKQGLPAGPFRSDNF